MTQIAKLDDAELERLADNPQNIVYKYQDTGERLKEVVPLEEVEQNIRDLWAYVKKAREKHENDRGKTYDWKASKYLEHYLTRFPRWKKFLSTHPLMFDRCVMPETTQAEIDAMYHTIHLKREHQAGRRPEAFEELRQFIGNTFSKPVEESSPGDIQVPMDVDQIGGVAAGKTPL